VLPAGGRAAVSHAARPLYRVEQPPSRRRNIGFLLPPTPQQERTHAGVATSAGPLGGWVQLSTSQQLDEICLYLLIWGEAANLRFMPVCQLVPVGGDLLELLAQLPLPLFVGTAAHHL
jgi:hypothetical protein